MGSWSEVRFVLRLEMDLQFSVIELEVARAGLVLVRNKSESVVFGRIFFEKALMEIAIEVMARFFKNRMRPFHLVVLNFVDGKIASSPFPLFPDSDHSVATPLRA